MSSPTSAPERAWSPQPSIEIVGAASHPLALAPLLNFSARITEPEGREVYTIALTCQVNVDPARRTYDAATRRALIDLFGEPERWGATARSFMWTKVDVLVKSFAGTQIFDIPVACTFDTELAAVKYFYSLPDGEVPLSFMFSGSIFYRGDSGELRLVQVPWSCDARYSLPIDVWRKMIDRVYPNRAWVAVQRETLESLRLYQQRTGLPSFDETVAELIAEAEQRTETARGL